MRLPLAALIAAALVASGDYGCGERSPAPSPRSDAGWSPANDAAVSDVAPPDAGPPAPWSGGTYTFPRPAMPSSPITAWCGSARPVIAGGYWPDAHHACVRQGWLYGDASGSLGRVRLVDGAFEQLTGLDTNAPHGLAGCQTDGLVFAMHSFSQRNDAIVQFADVTQPGVVRWWLQRHPLPDAHLLGGLSAFAASDQLTAWVWFEPDGPAHLVVAGSDAEGARELPVAAEPIALTASGSRLVYALGGDVWLWTAGAADAENLTLDHRDHYYPWIGGDHVVWEDMSGAAPGLYAMDLRTRTTTRITQTPPAQYRLQHTPVVAGDWVVWTDFRNATQATADGTIADRTEIWGYNFATGREYPIQTGTYVATQPLLVDGVAYFLCSPSGPPDGRFGLFAQPLPPP